MTSRLSTGGLQQVLGIAPDLTTFGKYLGGGLAFGAFGGRADLMQRFDPSRAGRAAARGNVQQRRADDGRGSGGPRASTPRQRSERLNGLGDRLRDRLNAFAAANDVEFSATGYGSLVGLHFTRGPVRRRSDVPKRPELQALLHLHMLEQGYTYARRGFIALSLPLGEREIDGFASAVEAFFAER